MLELDLGTVMVFMGGELEGQCSVIVMVVVMVIVVMFGLWQW